jgi:hypothetical protein
VGGKCTVLSGFIIGTLSLGIPLYRLQLARYQGAMDIVTAYYLVFSLCMTLWSHCCHTVLTLMLHCS